MAELFIYRNRPITSSDVSFIQRLIADHSEDGRCALSRRICQAWNWVQPNGRLKDMVCRGLLLILEREGLLALPPRKCTPNNPLAKRSLPPLVDIDRTPLYASIQDLSSIDLRQVRKSGLEKLFNSLIEHYHYLGYTQPVGEHLKYVALVEDRPIACFAWSSCAYQIGCRDVFIGWSSEARARNRHLLAYNSRFLILPWVHVPHLASHLLAKCARTISTDWLKIYHHPIYWTETFVDTERFRGTCYRAANWIFLGHTAGRGKYNKTRKKLTSIKAMYGYPLVRDFRRRLCFG